MQPAQPPAAAPPPDNNDPSYSGDVANNTGTINNDSPGDWHGNVLSNNGTINNNLGAQWFGYVFNSAAVRNYGTWSGNFSGLAGDVYNDGATAVWNGNVLTNDSQIVNQNGATWNGKVEGNNNVVFNLSSSFWSGDVVANGGGSNGLTQIDNYGTWTGNVDSNAAEINNLSGSWSGNVIANAGAIVNNNNDVNTNPGGVNHAVWTGNVTTNTGLIVNDHGGIWNGDVLANNGAIVNQSGSTWTGNVLGNSGAITNNATWSGNVASNAGTLTNNLTWIGTVTNAGRFNNNAGATLSGLLTNSGTANNAGTLSGGLTNTAGTTNNSGSIGGVTTISGGTLTGNGTTANLAIAGGGTFAPGAPATAGTATVSGNLVFQSGAFYAVQVTPATASLARVSGTAMLAGTVQANFALGGYVQKQYTILTAAGGLGGTTFAGLANTGLQQGGIDSLSYDANDVYLNLKPGLLQFAGLNGNQQAVANLLTNYFNNAGGIPLSFFNVRAGGLTQLDGEAATGAENAAFQLTTQFLNLMLDPFMNVRSGTGGSGGQALGFAPDAQAELPPDVALAYAGVLKALPAARFAQRWTAWGAAFGGGSSISADSAATSSNVTARTYGVSAGWIIMPPRIRFSASRSRVAAPIGACRAVSAAAAAMPSKPAATASPMRGRPMLRVRCPSPIIGSPPAEPRWGINSPVASRARATARGSKGVIASRRCRGLASRLTPPCRRRSSPPRASARSTFPAADSGSTMRRSRRATCAANSACGLTTRRCLSACR
jgi:hypothetical protein